VKGVRGRSGDKGATGAPGSPRRVARQTSGCPGNTTIAVKANGGRVANYFSDSQIIIVIIINTM